MSGINKCIIVGNLGDNPTINQTKNGETVANISVATSEKWRDRTSNEQIEKTEWHRVSIFGKPAEFAFTRNSLPTLLPASSNICPMTSKSAVFSSEDIQVTTKPPFSKSETIGSF